MARTQLEIETSIKESLRETNPSIDLEVGPTYNYLIRPVPRELVRIENEQERLARFYSQDFPLVATPQEARDFARNFGLSAHPGGRALTTVVFFRNTPVAAGTTAEIPVGVLISSADSSIVFRTVESKTMFGDFAQTYFNPTTNKYEIDVFVEALNPGILYNVAPFRLTRIMTGQIPFDGIEQRAAANGGTEPEGVTDLLNRVIKQFKGLNLGSITGIENLARNIFSTSVLDVRVIRPTDREEFRRPAPGPSLDVCVLGFENLQYVQEFVARGGETTITLNEGTTTSISTVSLNGLVLDATEWTYLPDQSAEWRGSTRAQNKIQVNEPLLANDIVEIVGIKNNLLNKIQATFSEDESELFETNILVRSFVELPIVVKMEIKIKSNQNVDFTQLEEAAAAVVSSYIEPLEIPSSLSAEGLRLALRRSVPEIDSIKVTEFRRQFKSLDAIEYIVPRKNEHPRYNTVASNIVVRI